MALLFQSLLLLIGLSLVVILDNKGYFINLCLGLGIIFLNQLLNLEQILFILGSAIGFYILVKYLENLVIKISILTYSRNDYRWLCLKYLSWYDTAPIIFSTVFGPVLGVPLIRRFAKLGYKAYSNI